MEVVRKGKSSTGKKVSNRSHPESCAACVITPPPLAPGVGTGQGWSCSRASGAGLLLRTQGTHVWPHLAKCSQVPVLAFHQELCGDVPGGLHFSCFFVLLMEFLNLLFQIYHLKQRSKIHHSRYLSNSSPNIPLMLAPPS